MRTPRLKCDLSRKIAAVSFGDNLLGIFCQGTRLRHEIKTLKHFGIGFRSYLQAFFLPESVDKNLALNIRFDPLIVLKQIRFSVGHFVCIERLAEILHYSVIDLKVLGYMVIERIVLREVEERIVLQ